jgi:ribosomal protein L18
MPWDPEAYKTGKVEYLEEELNQLMNEKNKNESFAKSTFENRIKETKQKAIDENVKKAEKTGNKLTQTIDENGNLVGINKLNTQENELKENEIITTDDIRSTLFEGENIVIDKNSDHGMNSLVGDPFHLKNI